MNMNPEIYSAIRSEQQYDYNIGCFVDGIF